MKIVNRAELLKLPVGTLYSEYGEAGCRELFIKGQSLENDFFYVGLIGAVDCISSDDQSDAFDAMEAGASRPVDFDTETREGLFDPDETPYVVYEPADVEALIARLQMALRGESVYTREQAAREATHPNKG